MMRIPIWPGIRLSVWEKQNPDAVQVRLPYAQPRQPLRRVLSKRGWMLLLVRYDWRDHKPVDTGPSSEQVVADLIRELHRRKTHLETLWTGSEGGMSPLAVNMVAGEIQGLQGALGVALGGVVAGGDADRRGRDRYVAWAAEYASEWNRCRCSLCKDVLHLEAR